jgi:prepilin-type N-terminal cleavage/methylation domain-containing protein
MILRSKKQKLLRAFTLVELSIVLVIIGLLIAGVTVGNSLMGQAKLRALVNELNSYNNTINNFRLRYNALPGDLSTASSFWTGATNGNGNGTIELGTPNTTTQDESVLAWYHLYLAGMINGTYTGSHSAASTQTPGTDCPLSKYGPATGWYFDGQSCYPNYTYLTFGAVRSNAAPSTSALTTAEIYSIDSKIDDGLPQSGNILASYYSSATPGTCTNASVAQATACAATVTNTYNLSASGALCILHSVFIK